MSDIAVRTPETPYAPQRLLAGLSPTEIGALSAVLAYLDRGTLMVTRVDPEGGGLIVQFMADGGATTLAGVTRMNGHLALMDFLHGLEGASGRYETVEALVEALRLALGVCHSIGRH